MASAPRTMPFVDDVDNGHLSAAEISDDLHRVLTHLEASHLKLKPRKCWIGYAEVEFLGHKISTAGISAHKDKIAKVVTMEPLRSRNEVRSFHGLVGYYQQFMRGFADIAKPLNTLLGQSVRFTGARNNSGGSRPSKRP